MSAVHHALTWTIELAGNLARVALAGELTERASLVPLAELLRASARIELDLAGITRINSVGVRAWLYFVRELCRHSRVELWECPPVFVAQLNMISNLADAAEVQTIQLPYSCELCDAVAAVSCGVTAGRPDLAAHGPRCPHDGSEMVFDDLPELYLGFLAEAS